MKFGIFYEHQLPRPWEPDSELQLFQDALDQVELADTLGIDYAWEVEHHFLEEYSHSSAPEVFLAACSQRTRRIRLGHGIVLMPPGYNQPARVAERIATLDLVSRGRVDWGTGESASRAELEGYGVKPAERRAMWRETVEQVANMMVMEPYPGFQGQFFSMPTRNVLPKPVQKPHPPIWVACSNRETIHLAAQLGIGALTFAFIDPAEASHWVADYYETFKRECVPIGHAVNPNIAMVTGFSCHPDAAEARPEFKEREAEREARKMEERGPAIEAAFARKQAMPPLVDGQIPTYQAYGNTIALTEADIAKLPDGNRQRVLTFRRIAEIAE